MNMFYCDIEGKNNMFKPGKTKAKLRKKAKGSHKQRVKDGHPRSHPQGKEAMLKVLPVAQGKLADWLSGSPFITWSESIVSSAGQKS